MSERGPTADSLYTETIVKLPWLLRDLPVLPSAGNVVPTSDSDCIVCSCVTRCHGWWSWRVKRSNGVLRITDDHPGDNSDSLVVSSVQIWKEKKDYQRVYVVFGDSIVVVRRIWHYVRSVRLRGCLLHVRCVIRAQHFFRNI